MHVSHDKAVAISSDRELFALSSLLLLVPARLLLAVVVGSCHMYDISAATTWTLRLLPRSLYCCLRLTVAGNENAGGKPMRFATSRGEK